MGGYEVSLGYQELSGIGMVLQEVHICSKIAVSLTRLTRKGWISDGALSRNEHLRPFGRDYVRSQF